MVLSTKEHHEVMENLSIKCSAYCSLLPPITSIPSEINPQEPSSNEATSPVSTLITQINSSNKIKGELLTPLSLSLHCNLNLVLEVTQT
jgi:malonyl-CoA/methylmalonyl-CoA synthetase